MYAAAIDTALAAVGLVRKVALWEPSFLAVAGVVANTDLISTVPKRLATYVAQGLPIRIHDLPLPLAGQEFAMYWHPRNQNDAGHKWLRAKVAALLRA
jgi:DNA-binding transcriptional LysR family regulator